MTEKTKVIYDTKLASKILMGILDMEKKHTFLSHINIIKMKQLSSRTSDYGYLRSQLISAEIYIYIYTIWFRILRVKPVYKMPLINLATASQSSVYMQNLHCLRVTANLQVK